MEKRPLVLLDGRALRYRTLTIERPPRPPQAFDVMAYPIAPWPYWLTAELLDGRRLSLRAVRTKTEPRPSGRRLMQFWTAA